MISGKLKEALTNLEEREKKQLKIILYKDGSGKVVNKYGQISDNNIILEYGISEDVTEKINDYLLKAY